MLSDSYKYSHYNQYPPKTEGIFSYMESRGGIYPKTVFFGLQYYLKEYLSKPITAADVLEAQEFARHHGIPFYNVGWAYILRQHDGYLPLRIRAVREGSVIPTGNVLMTIETTDIHCAWLVNWAETLLMKLWYPITVATKSYYTKQMMKKYWEKTSDNVAGIDFAFHNFGDRGSTSVEAASIGGMAHLTSFAGTDNFNSTLALKRYYGKLHGYSIPATEHSTITSWGRANEFAAISNHLETYKDSSIIACVMDSYNIYDAVSYITSGTMKDKIESVDYPTFVIRPDSGDPIRVIGDILRIMLTNGVAKTVNSKGYIVFNKYRIIWGDGIDAATIDKILQYVTDLGYAADNFAFGSGGDLMQKLDRDTCKFAIKCSAALVEGQWRDVYKDPITDPGKKSKKGILSLYLDDSGNYTTKEYTDNFSGVEQLWKVFENGKLLIEDDFISIMGRIK